MMADTPEVVVRTGTFLVSGIRRGDYMGIAGQYQYAETTGGSRGPSADRICCAFASRRQRRRC